MGEDRLQLLHALATNALDGLGPGQGAATFFLNPQGRIQALARIYAAADHILIDCDPASGARLAEYLESYIIMDDVSLEDVSSATCAWAVEGPQAEQVLRAAGFNDLPAAEHAHSQSGETRLFRSALSGASGFWLTAPAAESAALRSALESGGAVPASHDDFDLLRVENKIPLFGVDYFNSNIPHETQQLAFVSFTKGCYVGQEIVERVRAQGRVNRLLTPLEIDAPQPPADPQVLFDSRPVGQATSLRRSPEGGRVVGFALLRREALQPGAGLTVGGAPARTCTWP
jgi:aminomethyltransferase